MEEFIGILRLRGTIKVKKTVEDTMANLGLKTVNSFTIVPKTASYFGMVKKMENFVTWGEVPKDITDKKSFKPFKIKSKKLHFPKGDLGYRPNMAEFISKLNSDSNQKIKG